MKEAQMQQEDPIETYQVSFQHSSYFVDKSVLCISIDFFYNCNITISIGSILQL